MKSVCTLKEKKSQYQYHENSKQNCKKMQVVVTIAKEAGRTAAAASWKDSDVLKRRSRLEKEGVELT